LHYLNQIKFIQQLRAHEVVKTCDTNNKRYSHKCYTCTVFTKQTFRPVAAPAQ